MRGQGKAGAPAPWRLRGLGRVAPVGPASKKRAEQSDCMHGPACTCTLHLHPAQALLLHPAAASCTSSTPCLHPVLATSTCPPLPLLLPVPCPSPALSRQLGHWGDLWVLGGRDTQPGHLFSKDLSGEWELNPAHCGLEPTQEETLLRRPREAALMSLVALMSFAAPAIGSCIPAASPLNFHCSSIASPPHAHRIPSPCPTALSLNSNCIPATAPLHPSCICTPVPCAELGQQ